MTDSFRVSRYYSSEKNSSSGSSTESSSDSETDNSKANQEGEALLNILSSSSSSSTTQQQQADRNASRGNSAALIMETLSRATDRQQQASSRPSSFLNTKLFGGALSGRHFLGETQTCSHNLHIHASMNNTILTLTDSNGDPITTQSAGSAGLKKSARSGPEAGYQAMTKMIEKVEEKNVHIQTLHVLMKGFGPGRDAAFKAIRAKTNWDIRRISDTTPVPFNGCRPPKARRL
jgi:small subunit ribosomal protein S11